MREDKDLQKIVIEIIITRFFIGIPLWFIVGYILAML
jgi:hypothetical protein